MDAVRADDWTYVDYDIPDLPTGRSHPWTYVHYDIPDPPTRDTPVRPARLFYCRLTGKSRVAGERCFPCPRCKCEEDHCF